MYIVTIVALVMAASLGWFAFRLLREERRRADARVAVLTAALDRAEPVGWDLPVRRDQATAAAPRGASTAGPLPDATPVPTVSPDQMPELVFLDDDLRHGRAFLSEHDEWADGATHGRATLPAAAVNPSPAREERDSAAQVRVGGLLADVPEARRGDARGLIALVGVILVALLAVGYTWWSAAPDEPARAATAAPAPSTATPTSGGVPLELTSLGHEQRRGGLVVRGVVRNPVAGSDRTDLVANVTLLDGAGGVLASNRAAVQASRLRPGRDAAFSVQLPSHADVRRYRVTFGAADGSLVAHADRRTRQP